MGNAAMNQWSDYINKIDIFSSLTDSERQGLLVSASERELKRPDVLFAGNAAATHLYVLTRGAVKLMRNGTDSQRLLVDFVKPGEVIGEECILISSHHDLSAVPLDSAGALCLPLENVKKTLEAQPRFARALATLCAGRARDLRERLFAMTTASVPARLGASLSDLARRFGKRDKRGILIPLRVTHQDLADHIGASRETVSLFISRFRRQGLITMNVRRIIVSDLKALKKIV
jgi:CRP/FNR family transcriptional regulator, cyclic AMP receptor protein